MKIFKIIESGYGTNSSFEYGDGSGTEDGNGSGTGIRYVYGSGCGDRYGSGFGNGNGIGCGYKNVLESENGDGYGFGYGTGCGDEDKTGFGSRDESYIQIPLNKKLEKVIFQIYNYFQIFFSIELIENKQVICIEENLINQVVSFIILNFKEIKIEKIENNFIFFKNF